MKYFILSIIIFLIAFTGFSQPENFNVESAFNESWEDALGITFADTSLSYVWEKNGKVFAVVDGEKIDSPVIDISDEVGSWQDHGLLGFELHPDFLNNGYVYLFYTVDRHHLLYFGTGQYSQNTNEYNAATIGRLTRYTIDLSDHISLVEDSRKIILGEGMTDGVPLLTSSHAVNTIRFGSDGTILLSTGDSNVPDGQYYGEGPVPSGGYDSTALLEGLITEAEMIGAFRSQYLNGLNGKLLRIDAETGEGVPSNPFYDNSNPNSPKSKIWALGLRNPYRFTVKEGTGSQNPEDGNPGTIYMGDVGYWSYEEINIVETGGQNFGWPEFEGVNKFWGFSNLEVDNYMEPYNGGECNQEYYYYTNLLKQNNESHNVNFLSPCNSEVQIPDSVKKFIHSPPVLMWKNTLITPPKETAVPFYDDNGEMIALSVDDEDSPVESGIMDGYASIGGDFYTGEQFPDEYKGSYFSADYSGWIKQFVFDENNELKSVVDFMDDVGDIVQIKMNPYDQCLYYTVLKPTSDVKKICYGGNLSPIIEVQIDNEYGSSPLTVNFNAADSYDPDSDQIDFNWDFGDGSFSSDTNPSHIFVAPDNEPFTFTVTLTVTDTSGGETVKEIKIFTNNTPPEVNITSFEDGDLYSMDGISNLPLEAEVIDNEHGPSELFYEWRLRLMHNTHSHPNPIDTNRVTSVAIEPLGCQDLETYSYKIELTVTDAQGLQTYVEQFIYPDCNPLNALEEITFDDHKIEVYPTLVRNQFFIQFNSDNNELFNIQVFNELGQVVINEEFRAISSLKTVNANQLSKGLYIVRLYSLDEVYSFKIIKTN